MRALPMGIAGAALLLITAATPGPGEASAAPESQLSEAARSILRPRMQRHGAVMDQLVRSVVMLDRARTLEGVDAVLSEARLARPLPNDKESINAVIPLLFFDLQNHLHARAAALKQAAVRGDDGEVANAFGQLMQTCVACHSAYLDKGRHAGR